jgi:hypothetical protein
MEQRSVGAGRARDYMQWHQSTTAPKQRLLLLVAPRRAKTRQLRYLESVPTPSPLRPHSRR